MKSFIELTLIDDCGLKFRAIFAISKIAYFYEVDGVMFLNVKRDKKGRVRHCFMIEESYNKIVSLLERAELGY